MLHCVDPPCKLQWHTGTWKPGFDCGCMRLAYFLIPLNYWVGGRKRLRRLLGISKLNVRWGIWVHIYVCVHVCMQCDSVGANGCRDLLFICVWLEDSVCSSIVFTMNMTCSYFKHNLCVVFPFCLHPHTKHLFFPQPSELNLHLSQHHAPFIGSTECRTTTASGERLKWGNNGRHDSHHILLFQFETCEARERTASHLSFVAPYKQAGRKALERTGRGEVSGSSRTWSNMSGVEWRCVECELCGSVVWFSLCNTSHSAIPLFAFCEHSFICMFPLVLPTFLAKM